MLTHETASLHTWKIIAKIIAKRNAEDAESMYCARNMMSNVGGRKY